MEKIERPEFDRKPLSPEETKDVTAGGAIDRGGPLPAQKVARPDKTPGQTTDDSGLPTPPIFVPPPDIS